MDFRSIATERISCDAPATSSRLVVRYGSEKRVAFQTPRTRVRVVKTRFNTQLHRILDSNTVPRFEAFLENVIGRLQSSAHLDPRAMAGHPMTSFVVSDETDIYGTDGSVYDDDLVAGNEYTVACIVALTGVWVQMSERGEVVSWGPNWTADQVKVYETNATKQEGRIFFNGKPFFVPD